MKSSTFLKISMAFILSCCLLDPASADNKNARPNETGPWPEIQVNTYTGNLFYQRTDLSIPALGDYPLEIIFSYNSLKQEHDKGYGNGWTFNFGMYYKPVANTIVIFREEGDEDIFTWDGAIFVPPPGVYDVLTEYETGKYLLRTKYGIRYYFEDNSHKHLTKITDRNNNTITLSYTNGKPTTITDPSGRVVNLNWVGDHLSSLTDPNTSPNRVIAFTYDGSWNVTQVNRPLGNTWLYGYDVNGNLISLTDPRSNTLTISYDVNEAVAGLSCPPVSYNKTFTYDNCDNTTTVHQTVSALPRQTIYTYDLTGRITKIQLPDGSPVFYTWDGKFNLITYTDEMGGITTYSYDPMGNLLSETDCLGMTETYTYESAFNLLISFINKNGASETYTYDGFGNRLTLVDCNGFSESYSYDGNGNLTGKVDKRGFTTTYMYNAYGNLTKITWPDSFFDLYTYDAVGNMTISTDKRGFTTTYTYDLFNRLISSLDALGYTISNVYDGNGNLTSETNQNNKTTTYSYDPLNRQIGITNALSGTTSYILDEAGNILSETDTRDSITTYTYDVRDRQISITDCKGNSELYVYDVKSNIISTTDKHLNTTTYSYDCLGRMILITYPDTYTESYTYDNVGNQLSYIDKKGIPTTYIYDGLNRLTSTQYAYGFSDSFAYDGGGNKTSFTDNRGFITTYSYDALGRLTMIADPMAGVVAYVYDAEGNRISHTDLNGNTTTYTYDALGRLTGMTDPFLNIEAYTYDGVGNQLTVTDKKGNTSIYTYDGLDRLTGTQDPMGYSESFGYDEMGNLLSLTDKNGNITAYAYDGLNRLKSTTDPLGFSESYTYDLVGHRISLKEKNLGITSWSYSCCNLMSTTDPLAKTEFYGYDQKGYMTSLTNKKGQITSYQYDNLDRLTNITTPLLNQTQYTYDGNGNPISMTDANYNLITYIYNPRNEMISIQYPDMTSVNYTYDNNGNVTQANHFGGIGDNTTFSYDALNRLTLKTTNYGSFSKSVGYTYDENSNCSSMTTETGTIYYLYDLNNRLIQVTDQNSQITSMNYDGVGNMTEVHHPNGVSTYTGYDAMGNVLSVITRDVIPISQPGPAPVKKVIDRANDMLFMIDYGVAEIMTPVSAPGLTDHELVTIHVMNYGIETLPSIMVSYSIDGGNPVEETILVPIPPLVLFPYTFFQTGDFSEPGHTYELSARTIVPGDQNPGNDFTMSLVTNGGGGGGAIYQSFVYEYDMMGNKTREEHMGGSFITFTYNLRNELLSENMMPSGEFLIYTYTNTGLRASENDNGIISLYNYNSDDILISEGATTYIPDNKGNRIEKIDIGGTTTYSYGFDNELRNVVLPGGDNSQYEYSPFGRLLQKMENGIITYMVNEGGELLSEVDNLGILTYYYNPGLSIKDGTLTGYYFEDGTESATLQMNPSKAIIATAEFDEYGNLNSAPQPWLHDRMIFGDMVYSSATGLYSKDVNDFFGPTMYFDPNTGQLLNIKAEDAKKGTSTKGNGKDTPGGKGSTGEEAAKDQGASKVRYDFDGNPVEKAKPAEPVKSDPNKKEEKKKEEKKKEEEEEQKKCPDGDTYFAPVEKTAIPITDDNLTPRDREEGKTKQAIANERAIRSHISHAEESCEKEGATKCVGVCSDCNKKARKCQGQFVSVNTRTTGGSTELSDKKVSARVIAANFAKCKCVCK